MLKRTAQENASRFAFHKLAAANQKASATPAF
jgi:hypothetical protein